MPGNAGAVIATPGLVQPEPARTVEGVRRVPRRDRRPAGPGVVPGPAPGRLTGVGTSAPRRTVPTCPSGSTAHRAPTSSPMPSASCCRRPLDDPFAEEVVVVPAKGVERWLTQRLSHRLGAGARGGDGVCAGVRFLNPRSLVSMLLDRERDDAWDPDRLVWPLLETIDAQPRRAVVRDPRHPPRPRARRRRRRAPPQPPLLRRPPPGRPLRVVRRPAADARHRLARRRDTDGAGGDLDDDLVWQAELWRRLLDRVGEPAARRPARRHPRAPARGRRGARPAVAAVAVRPHPAARSPRSSCCEALGESREVHVWLPQPSPQLWDDLAGIGGVVPREDDDSAELVRPPAARLARARHPRAAADARCAVTDGDAHVGSSLSTTPGHSAGLAAGRHPRPTTPRRPPSAPTAALADDDRSLQVHACHGAARQVDVLREVLVGLLEDDPTLEPRDILVMCPDIETFAPLISAGFGLATRASAATAGDAGHPAHQLRVKLADRALTSTNPLLAVAGHAARAQRRPGHRLRRARPGLDRGLPAPLLVHRRRARPDRPLGRRGRRPLGHRPARPGRRSRWRGSSTTPGGPASTGSSSASP